MRPVDAWRLMGPNLQTREPAVLVEVALDPGDEARVFDVWKGEVARMAAAIGLATREPAIRLFRGGAVLTFLAPVDELLAATDVGEWAAHSAAAILVGNAPLPLEPKREELARSLTDNRNPRLLELIAESARRGLPLLWDDAEVSIGLGCRSRTWPVTALPADADIPWAELGTIPVGLVTGTNGKTTSTRLVAKMARAAGYVVGSTSTEGVFVSDVRLGRGDYTGPVGARQVLRHPDVNFAVLETARGGILRRGLAVESADAALITNVSDDHLGDYGVDDVATMARVKAVVGRAVHADGRVVLNADDAGLMELKPSFSAAHPLFSLDADAPLVNAHIRLGGEAWLERDGLLVHTVGATETPLLRVEEIPITMGGAARYNVANALGAAALAWAMGIPTEAIVAALRAFDPTIDNPGRGNVFTIGEVVLLLDFGHNPRGVHAALGLATSLRGHGARLLVIGGHAGDRLDENLRDVAREIHAAGPVKVFLRDIEGYLRGRAPGEVPGIFRDELVRLGMAPDTVEIASSEAGALARALDEAAPRDVVVILAHVDEEPVRELLAHRGARTSVPPGTLERRSP